MPRGGKREGAGRPSGSKDSKPRGQVASDAHRKGLQDVFAENFSGDDLAELIDDLKTRALGGHYKSAELLVNYGMGRPMVFSDITSHAGLELTGDDIAQWLEDTKAAMEKELGRPPEDAEVSSFIEAWGRKHSAQESDEQTA